MNTQELKHFVKQEKAGDANELIWAYKNSILQDGAAALWRNSKLDLREHTQWSVAPLPNIKNAII